MDMLGRTVDDCRDTFHVRFPHTVAASVGVADLDAKRNAFAAIITFCHEVLIPFVGIKAIAQIMITKQEVKSKQYFHIREIY